MQWNESFVGVRDIYIKTDGTLGPLGGVGRRA